MKILYLVDPLPNYVSDPLYFGLVKILGQNAVIDYPTKAVLHDPSAKVWFLPQVTGSPYAEEEIRTLLTDRYFDLICVASPRHESLESLARFYTPKRFPPIVFVDSADETSIRHDVNARFPLAVYFKREYVWNGKTSVARFIDCARAFRFDRSLFAKTYPLQISVVLEEIPRYPIANKDIDVSFYGHASNGKRPRAIALLKSLEAEGVRLASGLYGAATDKKYKLESNPVKRLMTKILNPSTVSVEEQKRKLVPEEYYQTLVRSKVAVSIRGGGFDTFRYWEIIACKTLLVSELPNIVIPHNFERGKHAVFCRPDLRDLKDLIRYYVRHDDEREAIAENGYAHLLKHHTCERRAQYFLDICNRNI